MECDDHSCIFFVDLMDDYDFFSLKVVISTKSPSKHSLSNLVDVKLILELGGNDSSDKFVEMA